MVWAQPEKGLFIYHARLSKMYGINSGQTFARELFVFGTNYVCLGWQKSQLKMTLRKAVQLEHIEII